MSAWSEQQYNRNFPYGVDSINAKRFNNPGKFDYMSDKELCQHIKDIKAEIAKKQNYLKEATDALESRKKYSDYDGEPDNDKKERSITGIDNPADYIDFSFDTTTKDDDIII